MWGDGGSGASFEHGQPSPQRFSSPESCPALVLNADYQPLSYMPLSLWSWQDSVKAVFLDRVVVVETYSRTVRSASNLVIQIPSVIALKEYVSKGPGEGKHDAPNFTRRNLFLRDTYMCQYCGNSHVAKGLTMDHVVPRCKGGATSWTNVVACCNPCNNRKGFSTLRQIEASYGMRLLNGPPRVPSSYDLQARARRFPPTLMHETWENYLCLTDDAKKRTRSLVARQREAPDEGGGGVLLKKNEEMKNGMKKKKKKKNEGASLKNAPRPWDDGARDGGDGVFPVVGGGPGGGF